MPVATKVKECNLKVRDPLTGVEGTCDTPFKGERCPRFREHVWPYPSGFCQGKHACEGTKPKSPSGKPMKTCEFWLLCPCTCHSDLTEMFSMLGHERRLVDNPEYIPPVSNFVLPPYEDLELVPGSAPEQTKTIIKSDHEKIPDTVVKDFEQTGSRTPRGLLEQNVKLACDYWVKESITDECTTLWVQEHIENWLDMPTVSRGAIHACWKRWDELGFAFIADNPVRFICYTPKGIKLGLEGIKAEAKRVHRQKVTDIKLGRGR